MIRSDSVNPERVPIFQPYPLMISDRKSTSIALAIRKNTVRITRLMESFFSFEDVFNSASFMLVP